MTPSLGTRPVRWQRVPSGELERVIARLESWPCEVGGAVRHMFPLASIESQGAEVVRVAERGEHWAACVVLPGKVVVPCGDPEAIGSAGAPVRRWRLLVGDAGPAEALLGRGRLPAGMRVHEQRFMTVDRERVPGPSALPDPGLRAAVPDDLPALAELAAQLHVDDQFGPDPGRAGRRGYASRLESSIARGLVSVVGPVGQPVFKLERSVASPRYGVQLAGIIVDRGQRGRGLGAAAVAAAVRAALREGPADRPVSLHVRAANTPARRAYVRAGFVDREEWRLAVHA